MRAEWRRWSPERTARFIRDWNEGLPAFALAEKFGVARPFVLAATLRAQGHALALRGRGHTGRPKKSRPGDGGRGSARNSG